MLRGLVAIGGLLFYGLWVSVAWAQGRYLVAADEINALVFPAVITAVHYPGVMQDRGALGNKLSIHTGMDALALAYTKHKKGLLIYPRGQAGHWQLVVVLGDDSLRFLHVIARHGLVGQKIMVDQSAISPSARDRVLVGLMRRFREGLLSKDWHRLPQVLSVAYPGEKPAQGVVWVSDKDRGHWLLRFQVCADAESKKHRLIHTDIKSLAGHRLLAVDLSKQQIAPGACVTGWALCRR